MGPFLDKAQKWPLGPQAIANSETAWGISGLLGFVSGSGLASLSGRFRGPPANGVVVPRYEM